MSPLTVSPIKYCGGQSLAAKRSPQAALLWNQITGLQKERTDLQTRLGAIH